VSDLRLHDTALMEAEGSLIKNLTAAQWLIVKDPRYNYYLRTFHVCSEITGG